MADVTISGLGDLALTGSTYIPVSDGTTTGKATITSLPVSYTNLTDKPTIPNAQVNSDWNASSGITQILNKPSIGTNASGAKTISASAPPAGSGSSGDIWYQV